MNTAVDLATKVAFLRRPEVYPDQPLERVEAIETHMSWVFLTRHFAWKMKKPVRYPWLDFSTLERRRHFCNEELRLNRRLAPDVYLAVVPLVVDGDGALRLDARGRVVEWLVKSRRLPRERMLDRRLARGAATTGDVVAVARRLAGFYRAAVPVEIGVEAVLERMRASLASDAAAFARHRARPASVPAAASAALERLQPLIAERVGAGRIVEGHGDLRPEHVCLLSPPVVIDCLEFDRRLRLLDPLEELAFLAMESEVLGAAWLERPLLEGYAEATADRFPPALVIFYRVLRASLRARLVLSHLDDHPSPAVAAHWQERARRYLELAARDLERLAAA